MNVLQRPQYLGGPINKVEGGYYTDEPDIPVQFGDDVIFTLTGHPGEKDEVEYSKEEFVSFEVAEIFHSKCGAMCDYEKKRALAMFINRVYPR